MSSSFELFKKQLDDAVSLIESKGVGEQNPINLPSSIDELVDTQSLIARCEAVCEKHTADKPVIRVIHHLACSGGTLFSKCLAAMPNVYLLSEVHPYTELALNRDRPSYAPTDIVSLTKYANIPEQDTLAGKLFKQAIAEVYQHVERVGGILVLRDHTHADFNTDSEIPKQSKLVSLLKDDYDIKSVLTVREPIDSYASLVKNGWVHFSPKTFDEYCRRLLLLLEQFTAEQVISYESFLKSPQEQMLTITNMLALPFDEAFENIFSIFKVTGDSGRSSGIISGRDRIASEDIIEQSKKSSYYQELKKYRAFLNNTQA